MTSPTGKTADALARLNADREGFLRRMEAMAKSKDLTEKIGAMTLAHIYSCLGHEGFEEFISHAVDPVSGFTARRGKPLPDKWKTVAEQVVSALNMLLQEWHHVENHDPHRFSRRKLLLNALGGGVLGAAAGAFKSSRDGMEYAEDIFNAAILVGAIFGLRAGLSSLTGPTQPLPHTYRGKAGSLSMSFDRTINPDDAVACAVHTLESLLYPERQRPAQSAARTR